MSSRSWRGACASRCIVSSPCRHVVMSSCFSSRVVVSSMRLVVFFSWRRGVACYAVSSGCGPYCRLSYRYRHRRHHRIGRCCVCCGGGVLCSSRRAGRSSWRRAMMRFCVCGSRILVGVVSVLASVHISLVVSSGRRAGRWCGSCLRSGRCSSVSAGCD